MNHSSRAQLLTLKLATFMLTASLLAGSNRHMSAAQDVGTPVPFEAPAPPAVSSSNQLVDTVPAPSVAPITPVAKPAAPAAVKKATPVEPADPFTRPVLRTAPPASVIEAAENPVGTPRATSPSDTERLRILEKQLLELTRELRTLRGGMRGDTPAPMTSAAPVAAPRSSTQSDSRPGNRNRAENSSAMPTYRTPTGTIAGQAPLLTMRSSDPNVESVAIVRATYKMSAERAAPLAKLLTEQLSDEVEVKVKGEAIQVTASPEDQQAIEQVIRLFQRRVRVPAKAPAIPETGA